MMSTSPRALTAIRAFLTTEASGGVLLMAAAAAALVIANSPLSDSYFHILHIKVAGLSLSHWINDGLMAVFFLLVGLEIKRETLDGELSSWSRRVLPGVAAIGGMLVPALIYLGFNLGSPETLRGWAIPAATDIAFALGVLSLLGPRVAPASLKIFLAALAIIDDLGAIVIIAVFYTDQLTIWALAGAGAVLALLITLNRLKITRLAPYLLLGGLLWWLLLKSGVHATLAGVALALTIPILPTPVGADDESHSPLHRLEHGLHPWVAYLIVPIFGFANAGVNLGAVGLAALAAPSAIGVAAGLFVGKQLGVFGFSALAIALGAAKRPSGANWTQLYGVSLLCGIGFTMSLFINNLAFRSVILQDETKLGVLAGSVLSALAGWAVLALAARHIDREQTFEAH